VAHVLTPCEDYCVPSALAPELDEQRRKDKRAYLDAVVKRLTAAARVSATSTLLVGHPADALYDHALAQGVDLVVMTTHGHGCLGRFWLGSVADDLMRRLPMPVLLVRSQEPAPEQTHEPVFQHVLIPLDGSERAEQILEPAVALGSLTAAKFTLLQVVNPLTLVSEETHAYMASGISQSMMAQLQQLQDQQQTEARTYLENVAGRLRARPMNVQVRVVSGRQPAAAILEAAGEQGIDLIALATRGRGGLTRLFLGSVADKVVRGAATPVLVHHPRNK
jgi:nucleotide-binding universal stress UspA family protein